MVKGESGMKDGKALIEFYVGYITALIDMYERMEISEERFDKSLRRALIDFYTEVKKGIGDGSSD